MIDNRASRRLAKVGRGAKNEIGRPSLLREYLSRRVARRHRSVRGVTSGHTVWQPFRSADTPCAFVGNTTSAAAPIRRLSPPPYTYYIYMYSPPGSARPPDRRITPQPTPAPLIRPQTLHAQCGGLSVRCAGSICRFSGGSPPLRRPHLRGRIAVGRPQNGRAEVSVGGGVYTFRYSFVIQLQNHMDYALNKR